MWKEVVVAYSLEELAEITKKQKNLKKLKIWKRKL
jgi:hypothetical protein